MTHTKVTLTPELEFKLSMIPTILTNLLALNLNAITKLPLSNLHKGFNWAKTSEGFSYWCLVAHAIGNTNFKKHTHISYNELVTHMQNAHPESYKELKPLL